MIPNRSVVQVISRKAIAALIFVIVGSIGFSSTAYSNDLDSISARKPKAAYDYMAVAWTLNEFRSMSIDLATVNLDDDGNFVSEQIFFSRFPVGAQPYSISGVIGSYLNDFAKSELRFGYGIVDDTIEQTLDINLNYWIAWYMGLYYPVTDYSNVYAQYGISHYQADITRREVIRDVEDERGIPTTRRVQPSRRTLDDKVFGTSFSTTFLFGADFSLGKIFKYGRGVLRDTYVALEYGRLIRDTESNIKVYQANLMVRYEY